MKLYQKIQGSVIRRKLDDEITRLSTPPDASKVDEKKDETVTDVPKDGDIASYVDAQIDPDNPDWHLADLISLRRHLDQDVRPYGRVYLNDRQTTSLANIEVSLLRQNRPSRMDIIRILKIRG